MGIRPIAEFVVKRRGVILLGLILITLFFGYHTFKIEMYTVFEDLLPKTHPYIHTHREFRKVFGGANIVMLSVEVKEGNIFNTKTLQKVKYLTDVLELTKGVNNYQIFSIARQKVKDIRATSWGIEIKPVMWPNVPQTEEEMEELKARIFANNSIYGRLVSLDAKAALVTATFLEQRLDYKLIFDRIQKAIREVEDENTQVYAAGEPILYGWIYHYLTDVRLIMLLSSLTILLVLILYYRNLNGVIIPIISAAVTFIWGTGFTGLLGYNFEPLILVVPFLIAARTISHSIQFRERFFEELERFGGDREKASVECAAGLMTPGTVSIITDAIGVTVLLIAPMPILTKLAIAGSFWVISNVFSVVILAPILGCYLPVPKRIPKGGEGHWLGPLLQGLGRACTSPTGSKVAIAAFGVVVVWSVYWNQFLTIGDSRPGSPLLWPGDEFNVSVRHINEKFQGTDQLYVIVKGKAENSMKSPEVLRTVETLQRHLERDQKVGGTEALTDLAKQVNVVLHNDDPRWGVLPNTPFAAAGVFMVAETGGEPGDFDRWVNYNFQDANVTVFLRDHQGDTIRNLIQKVKDFIPSHPMKDAEFKLAGGLIGVLAAANEVIERTDKPTLGLMLLAQLIFCALGFRSIVAGLLFVGVVLISNTFGMALMAYLNVGLNVNTLPVISLGIGFGEDYGIYIISRAIEEYARRGRQDFRSSVVDAVSTAGKAVLYTAFLISAGIALWVFSPIRFQAEMGYQLLIILTMNMLGGVLLLPAWVMLFPPKFMTREGARTA
jgi:predicted RND superfamily exporter protein